MGLGQDIHKVERLYDTVADAYAETFSGEHEKKPKDRELLYRFYREIGTDGRSGILAVVPAKPQPT